MLSFVLVYNESTILANFSLNDSLVKDKFFEFFIHQLNTPNNLQFQKEVNNQKLHLELLQTVLPP